MDTNDHTNDHADSAHPGDGHGAGTVEPRGSTLALVDTKTAVTHDGIKIHWKNGVRKWNQTIEEQREVGLIAKTSRSIHGRVVHDPSKGASTSDHV